MDCYIYYKTAAVHEAQVIAAVALLQNKLLTTLGLKMRLQRRPEITGDCLTWMEVYRDIPADFHGQLAPLLHANPLQALLQGERHAEYFEDAQLCV
ncbi:DUF4936 family protein [Undibacterium sp.]|uniref:DUF4936 family protein n=1 Tax=Undibacterium sp. TaxID=1914977 RepID=UPI0025E77BF7|nr:DUF4936 family protein [Undibacterium sp.]